MTNNSLAVIIYNKLTQFASFDNFVVISFFTFEFGYILIIIKINSDTAVLEYSSHPQSNKPLIRGSSARELREVLHRKWLPPEGNVRFPVIPGCWLFTGPLGLLPFSHSTHNYTICLMVDTDLFVCETINCYLFNAVVNITQLACNKLK